MLYCSCLEVQFGSFFSLFCFSLLHAHAFPNLLEQKEYIYNNYFKVLLY